MIVARKLTGVQGLADFFRGTPVASGVAGTNTASSPNLQDSTGTGGFADATVGDRVYISGENPLTVFLIQTKTDNNNVVLDNDIIAAHTGTAVWRVHKDDGFDPNLLEFDPIALNGDNDTFAVVYDSSTFGP